MKLRSNKETTDVPAEYLKVAIKDEEFLRLLTDVFADIWSTKNKPDDWRTNRLVTLFKNKGSPREAGNYRGLSIGSVICKVSLAIILHRGTRARFRMSRTVFAPHEAVLTRSTP